jgi:hypothetical protein
MARHALVPVVVFALTTFAVADPVLYTFDVTGGSVQVLADGLTSTTSSMAGTFAATIYQSDGHISESDTFVLEDAHLSNADHLAFGIAGLTTAHIPAGSLRFLEFAPDNASHIGPGGVATADTDVFMELTIPYVEGVLFEVLTTSMWADELLPFNVMLTTSVVESDVLSVTLAGTFPWIQGNTDPNYDTDFAITVEGTAHVVPDPALAGLTSLGVGAAGVWLRRRAL